MGRSRDGEIVEIEGKKYKMIEHSVDGNLTVKRTLVPSDTTEEDLSLGDRLLSEKETEGVLSRSAKTEELRVGYRVRLRQKSIDDAPDPTIGTVDAMLTSGKVRVAWEGRMKSKHDPEELTIVW